MSLPSPSLQPSASDPSPVPDLMLSFRHRDSLAQALVGLGRRVVAARRSSGLAARFAALGAHILLIDARDAGIEALTAVEAAAATVSTRGHGLIVLLGDAESEMAPAFIAAGAHRVIGTPWRDWELAAALLSADKSRRSAEAAGGALIGNWHADLLTGALAFEPASDDATLEKIAGAVSIRAALRQVDAETRRRAFVAFRQLREGAGHAVLVQPVADGRWIHHLGIRATILTGQVELLSNGENGRDGPRDPVTGLLRFDALTRMAGPSGDGRALALIEVGRLAQYNDAMGRTAGDALLAVVGRRLERQLADDLGAATLVVRVDGARFAVLAPVGVSAPRLSVELRALASVLADLMSADGMSPSDGHVALRVATGLFPPAQDIAATLAGLARRLAAPRATVHSLDVEAALAGEGLRVHFQPQFAFADDALVGAEALVRWQHPRLGEIGGAALFSAASAAALERPLSNAVWQRALAHMADWPSQLVTARLALNITAADLADPMMPGHLLGLAADHGIVPTRLTVEVTESAVIQTLDDAAAALRRLRAAGVMVALDDFGSGYSGLSWLKRLPVDYIKIDSIFARDAAGAPRDRAILAGVLGLAKALDLDVLAEGVETSEQYALLKAAGCRWYQGHLRAEALSPDEFAAYAAPS
jgi:EAL domain-containing protein (putative c-di-GMP-specific phosphodiesterase class I)